MTSSAFWPRRFVPAAPISAAEQADYGFMTAVIDEARRARAKFPPSNTTFAAAVEELGEVAQALMELQAGRDTRGHFYEECVQLAAMALRLAVEGDASFPASRLALEGEALFPFSRPALCAASDAEVQELMQFLGACTVAGEGLFVHNDELYRAYAAWCAAGGRARLNQPGFSLALFDHGVARAKTSIQCWDGIALKDASPETPA